MRRLSRSARRDGRPARRHSAIIKIEVRAPEYDGAQCRSHMSRFYNVKSDSRIRTLIVSNTASSADPTLSDAVRTRCDFVNFGSRIYKPLSTVARPDDTSTITTHIALLSITTHIALLAHLSGTHRLGVFETAPKFHKFTPESHWIRQCAIDSARRRSRLPSSLVTVRVW